MDQVLEIGCQEGLGSLVVSKSVKRLVATDFFRPHIEFCLAAMAKPLGNVEFLGHDIIAGPVGRNFDAAFSMDVIEHIDPQQEELFIGNICASLKDGGTFICGTPSKESQVYASNYSQMGHINCKSSEDWRKTFLDYFGTVLMFGMNDEVVHTGFPAMCHYIVAVCINPVRR
jgi:cyclopropane fatty-acyl-phospholipid synthase-like methyltransferase